MNTIMAPLHQQEPKSLFPLSAACYVMTGCDGCNRVERDVHPVWSQIHQNHPVAMTRAMVVAPLIVGQQRKRTVCSLKKWETYLLRGVGKWGARGGRKDEKLKITNFEKKIQTRICGIIKDKVSLRNLQRHLLSPAIAD